MEKFWDKVEIKRAQNPRALRTPTSRSNTTYFSPKEVRFSDLFECAGVATLWRDQKTYRALQLPYFKERSRKFLYDHWKNDNGIVDCMIRTLDARVRCDTCGYAHRKIGLEDLSKKIKDTDPYDITRETLDKFIEEARDLVAKYYKLLEGDPCTSLEERHGC